jgi:hypothetical protein
LDFFFLYWKSNTIKRKSVWREREGIVLSPAHYIPFLLFGSVGAGGTGSFIVLE